MTDKPRSCGAAVHDFASASITARKAPSNRVETSHRYTRRREKIMVFAYDQTILFSAPNAIIFPGPPPPRPIRRLRAVEGTPAELAA